MLFQSKSSIMHDRVSQQKEKGGIQQSQSGAKDDAVTVFCKLLVSKSSGDQRGASGKLTTDVMGIVYHTIKVPL